jgi:hypothetical protein
MKLPQEKQDELEDEGEHKKNQVRGGGAMGRLHQFEKERGLNRTRTGTPEENESDDAENNQEGG